MATHKDMEWPTAASWTGLLLAYTNTVAGCGVEITSSAALDGFTVINIVPDRQREMLV